MLPQAAVDPELQIELAAIYKFYSAFASDLDPEVGLGGKLFYAGELEVECARAVRAANIAGAASLCATSDAAAQRIAIREGIADFLVTSLDEALRILKNEIRKRNGVAVSIALSPSQVAREMTERGVQPDLVRGGATAELAHFVLQGARIVMPRAMPSGDQMLIVTAPPQNFESRALDLLPESDLSARRWLRLSSRYLGPQGRRIRSLVCSKEIAEKLRAFE